MWAMKPALGSRYRPTRAGKGHLTWWRTGAASPLLSFLLLCLIFLAPAFAQENPPTPEAGGKKLKILEAERLELRNEAGEELVILVGNPVKMERDGERIEAFRVIYNRTRKRLMLMGGVRYQDKQGQLIEAGELELFTDDESFEALEVKIESGEFFLSGPICQRAAGQILLQEGYLTPCQRCEQEEADYAFQAREVVLYPGDRIIARGVWVLLRGERTLYLPVLLLFLNERRPKLEFGQSESDGVFVAADLPYVSDFGIGFTLLRYFEQRGWGFGFDHFGIGAAQERYQFLYLPPPAGQALPDSDPRKDGIFKYRLSYKLEEPDRRIEGLILRDDSAQDEPRFLQGAGGQPDYTTFLIEWATRATPSHPEPLYRLTLDGYIDHNPLALPNERTTPQRLPEAEITFPRGLEGEFRLNGRVLLGYYEAPSNPLNRSARRLGPYIGAGRLWVEHRSSYRPATPPWPGLSFSVENTFIGRYYSTQNLDENGNPTEFERLIRWNTSASLGQTLGAFSLNLRLSRNVVEGETPFQFDYERPQRNSRLEGSFSFNPDPLFSFTARASRDLERRVFDPLAEFALTSRPFLWLNFTASASRDIELGRWGLLRSSLGLTPAPFSLNLSYERQLELGLDRLLTLSAAYNPLPFNFSLRTSYRYWDVQEKETRPPEQIPLIARYDPLELSASYNPPGNTTSLTHSRDLNNGQAIRTELNLVLQEAPNTFRLRQSFTHLYQPLPSLTNPTPTTVPAVLDGLAQLTLSLHTFVFAQTIGFSPGSETRFRLGYQYSADLLQADLLWNYREGLLRNPRLTVRAAVREPEIFINEVSAEFHFPESENPLTLEDDTQAFLRFLRFTGELELLPAPLRPEDPPGLSLQGFVGLERLSDNSGRFRVTLREFGPTISFMGQEKTRLFYRIVWNAPESGGTNPREFFLPNLEGTLLRPRFDLIIDRCCWAFRASLDTLKQEFKFSFALGGEAAEFLFNQNNIVLPGGLKLPSPGGS
ncbi:LPS-assembly protein LptD [Meiothermus ruber]|uniref:LPS-assembly protein LptD n=1 Tax=Meiothermus ruber TaxID=277 RepID=UPI00034C235A|nr:LPS-assembly protein LptD [Meiothermus ruber]GAO76018.1 Organic solvent tolerance protein OstA [Meiothermus ruber H328]